MTSKFRGEPGNNVRINEDSPMNGKTGTLISIHDSNCVILLDESNRSAATMKQLNAARIKKKDFPFPYNRWKNSIFGKKLYMAHVKDVMPVLFKVGDTVYSFAYGVGIVIDDKDECLQVSFPPNGFIKDYEPDGRAIFRETFSGDEDIRKPCMNTSGWNSDKRTVRKCLQRIRQTERLIKRIDGKLNGSVKNRMTLDVLERKLDEIYRLARLGNE